MSNTIYVLWGMTSGPLGGPSDQMYSDPVGFIWDDEDKAKEWARKSTLRGYWTVEEISDEVLNA